MESCTSLLEAIGYAHLLVLVLVLVDRVTSLGPYTHAQVAHHDMNKRTMIALSTVDSILTQKFWVEGW